VSDGLKEGSSRKFSSTVKATFESGFNNFVYSSTTFLLNVFISFTFFYEKRVFTFFGLTYFTSLVVVVLDVSLDDC